MKPYSPTETTADSDCIRANIQQTRQSMDHTLDELGEKMKPRHLFDELLGWLHLKQTEGHKLQPKAEAALHSVKQSCGRAAHAVGGVMRDHPIPTILVGCGVAWAIYESSHRANGGNERRRLTDNESGDGSNGSTTWGEGTAETWEPGGLKEKAAETWESTKEGIESTATKVKEKVSEAGHTIRERAAEGAKAIGHKATQLKEQVAHTAQRGYELGRAKFVETSQAHPFSIGLGFLAVGVLAGLALPSSQKENEWVGETADRVKKQAKAKGQDLLQRGKNVVNAAAETVKKTAEEEGLTPQALKDKVQRVANETGQAAQRSAEQQGLNPGSIPTGSQQC
jgi:hypothetical protein